MNPIFSKNVLCAKRQLGLAEQLELPQVRDGMGKLTAVGAQPLGLSSVLLESLAGLVICIVKEPRYSLAQNKEENDFVYCRWQ